MTKFSKKEEEKYKSSKNDEYKSSKNDEYKSSKNDEYKSSKNDDKYLSDFDIIFNKMRYDFYEYPYIDKILLEGDRNFLFGYLFEDGSKIVITKSLYADNVRLEYENFSELLMQFEVDKIIKQFHLFAKNCKKRPTYKSHFEDEFYRFFDEKKKRDWSDYEPKVSWNKKETTKKNYTTEQLKYQQKFRKLKMNHDIRIAQLNKMSKTDPNRTSLVNEVNVVKRQMKKLFDKSGLIMKKTK